jgi:hypothetical protein
MNNPEEEEKKIINRDDEIIKSENNNEMNNNNFISYLDSNSSRPDTPKLNNIKTNEENNNKKNENCDKKNEINNIIFSETLKTKLKDINSNSVSILENNNEILEYDENRNSRQTFYKNENIDENQNINNKELQKEISKEVKEEKTKIKEELIDNKNKINDNISKENLILNEEKIQEEENNIIIENNNDSGSKNQIDNKYNDKIKEKLKQIENLNMINANLNENKKIIINNDKKEENLNNIPNNINYINFKDMKEIYKENYSIEEEKEKESYKEIFNEKEIENKKVNNIDDLIHNINANNIDNLVIPILSNSNIVVENEINKKRNKTKKIKDIKQLNKSKSSEQFNTKFKMNKSSFKWLSTYNEKLISKIILSNSDKDKKISIFGIIKTLHSLKILHILLSKNNINLNELK